VIHLIYLSDIKRKCQSKYEKIMKNRDFKVISTLNIT